MPMTIFIIISFSPPKNLTFVVVKKKSDITLKQDVSGSVSAKNMTELKGSPIQFSGSPSILCK